MKIMAVKCRKRCWLILGVAAALGVIYLASKAAATPTGAVTGYGPAVAGAGRTVEEISGR